jgi:hypothetical protein
MRVSAASVGATGCCGPAIILWVAHDREIPEALNRRLALLERTAAVGRQLVGLHMDDARALATRSGCHLRVVKRNGKGLVATTELDPKRINVSIDDDIVVHYSTG